MSTIKTLNILSEKLTATALQAQVRNWYQDIDYNSETKFEYYDGLIRLRHDILHLCVQKAIGLPVKSEKSLQEIFPQIHHPDMMRTPDIVLITNEEIIIGDVTVTTDYYGSLEKKQKKYDFIATFIGKKLNKKVRCLYIIFDYLKGVINNELYKLEGLLVQDFDTHFFDDACNIIKQFLDMFYAHVDKEEFEKYKKSKYNQEISSDENVYTTNFKIEEDEMDRLKEEKYPYKVKYYPESITNLENVLKKELDDENSELFQKYIDEKNNLSVYKEISNELRRVNKDYIVKPKPVHHNLTPFPEEITNLRKVTGKASEQKMIKNFANFFIHSVGETDNQYVHFMVELLGTIDLIYKSDENRKCFEEGFYFDNQVDMKKEYKKKYGIINKKEKNELSEKEISKLKKKKKQQNISFYNHLVKEDLIKPLTHDIHTKAQKTIQIPLNYFSGNGHIVYKKSGSNYWKYSKEKTEQDYLQKIETTTTDFTSAELVDKMILKLSEDVETETYYDDQIKNLYNFTTETEKIKDDSYIKILKKNLVEEYNKPLELLLNTNSFHYLWFNHHFNTQLMHFMSLSLLPKNYYFFNCGIPNFLCVAVGGYRSIDSESGKAFLTMIITKNPDNYTEFYGKIHKHRLNNDHWLIITNWRRLPMAKITHMRDACYGVLSSTMNYYMNIKKSNPYVTETKIRRMMAVKTIISLCTTQQVAEFLMDNRYATMSAFSSYTNMKKLMIEKFAPPYHNPLSVWIVKKLLIQLPKITDEVVNKENIYFKIPEFDKGRRVIDTIGGTFKIPSLWLGTDIFVLDPQELLEEIFIYVHTMKEPSNQYHENIKALQTIIKYQNIFDRTDVRFKTGNIISEDDYKDFLLKNQGIGFSHSVIVESTKNTIEKTKPFHKKYINDVLTEPVSEIISTKAVIHKLNRKLEEMENVTRKKREFEKRKKIIQLKYGDEFLEKLEMLTNERKGRFYLNPMSRFYQTKIRQKVWETTIEYLEEHPEARQVIDIVENHIKKDKGAVEADICIKAQYGAKREFYVINFGAKASARIVEKYFQKLSEDTPNEAISIAGDKKVHEMQNMLDNAMSISIEKQMKLRYVNGDCTKWSAAETMGSFMAMCDGLQTGNSKFEKLLKTTFAMWADKKINIPTSIIDKVQPIMDQTDYLREMGFNQSQLKSTHNFLQGMFNYASSYKAVCCANYTIAMWEKLYGPDKLYAFHMEHSDDYVMIVLYKEESDFIKFRVLHKIMMRLHGYSDSERKTSCQQLFLEFVSLMSFNGVMLYPHIKKSKEINLSLPCTGYKSDIQASISRSGECLRVGCNLPFVYFFQKLHVYCVAEAYSLLPGMLNDFKDDYYNKPIEIYGFPDQHPIFSLLCTGDINNYRIYNYVEEGKNMLGSLFKMSQKTYEDNLEETYIMGEKEQAYSLFHPKYLFDYDNKSILKIRSELKINFDDIKQFWDDHISYRFVKPNERNNLIQWLKAMLYNRSFIEAYSASSRTKMTLRISKYVKTPTLLMNLTHNDLNKKIGETEGLKRISECYNEMMSEINKKTELTLEETNILKKLIVKCDANVTAIYSILTSMSVREIGENDSNPIATYTPPKITWLNTHNNAGIILQKIFNEEDFKLDNRKVKSLFALNKDIENLKQVYSDEILKTKNVFVVQNLYNDLRMSSYKPVVMMGYTRRKLDLVETVTSLLANSMSRNIKYKVTSVGITNVINPHTGELLYLKENKTTKDIYQQALNTISWIYMLLWKCQYSTPDIINIMKDLTLIEDKTFNALRILDLFNPSYCDSFHLSLDDQKMAAYLRAALLGNYDLIEHISNNVYSYSYNYLIRGNFLNGKYQGKSRCTFMYLGQTFEFIQMNNDLPVLYTNTKNPSIIKIAYVIALRLSNNLSENDFEIKMYECKLEDYLLEKDKLKFEKTHHKFLFLSKQGDSYIFKDKLIENKEGLVYPVIFTTNRLTQESKNTYLPGKIYSHINQQALCVGVGNYKLFNFPFWKAPCYNVLYDEKNRYIENINLNFIIQEKITREYYDHSSSGFRLHHLPKPEENIKLSYDFYKKSINSKYSFLSKLKLNDELKDIYNVEDELINEDTRNLEYEDFDDDNGGEMTMEQIMAMMGDIEMNVVQQDELIPDPDDNEVMELEEVPHEIRAITHMPVGFTINMENLNIISSHKKTKTKLRKGYFVGDMLKKKSIYYYMINTIYINNQSAFQMTTETYYITLQEWCDKFDTAFRIGDEELKIYCLCAIEFLLSKGYVRNDKNHNEMSIYYENNDFKFYKKRAFKKDQVPKQLKTKTIFYETKDFVSYAAKVTKNEWEQYIEKNTFKYTIYLLPIRAKTYNRLEEKLDILSREIEIEEEDYDDFV